MTTIRNFTPHAVVILDDNNQVVATFPSEGIIRVEVQLADMGTIGDIPIKTTKFGRVEGLPVIDNNDIIIVSRIVKDAAKLSATDIKTSCMLVPSELVRDDKGIIIGCKSLSL